MFFLFCADRLKEFFETYGKVQSVEIIFDNITHKSRNFAFLAFEDENVAKHVLSLRTVVIDGRTVTFLHNITHAFFFPIPTHCTYPISNFFFFITTTNVFEFPIRLQNYNNTIRFFIY